MKRIVATLFALTLCGAAGSALAQSPVRDTTIYEPRLKDPVLEQIKERHKKWVEGRDKSTEEIRARQKKAAKVKEDAAKALRATLPQAQLPGPPESFQTPFHFEPQAQYYTGTCWAFAATSFLESEAQRLSGKKVKLSEMHTVYYEYLEKARRFVQERGDSQFGEGSQHNAVTRMWKLYGAVPLAAYKGVLAEDGLHDHLRMFDEMEAFLQFVKANDLWDEEWVLEVIRTIMDRCMGPPPKTFKYKRKEYTPQSFVKEVLEVNPDDYVGIISTMRHPFFTRAEFEVEDNWWHDASYVNVPLNVFFETLVKLVKQGYTAAIGGDVSEPGKNHRQDVAFVPTFDIPGDYIDQASREYRIDNGATGDDHGIHLVGWSESEGKLWFLIKDSGRSARHGRYEGYYFFREDFVRLKMLSFFVHKTAVKELLEKVHDAPIPPTPAVPESP